MPRCRAAGQHRNVLAWINGHSHRNRITWRGGFWEITTASHVDFPQLARVIELVDNADGTMSLFTTLIESAAGHRTDFADLSQTGLASLYRELSFNAPEARDDLAGEPATATPNCSSGGPDRRGPDPRRPDPPDTPYSRIDFLFMNSSMPSGRALARSRTA